MNFLDGEVSVEGVAVQGLGVLTGRSKGETRTGDRACLAVRPERLTVAPASQRRRLTHDNVLDGTLTDIAYHGQDIGLHIAVGDGGQVLIARLSAAAEGAADFKVGDKVQVGWQAQNALILPEDSKR